MMRITKTTSSYNQRRYGRPWIAVVRSWPVGGRPELRWGAWQGTDGDAGTLEIEAEPGDIIRSGQKDHRGGKTDNNWAIVEADGSLRAATQAECLEHRSARTEA